MLPETPDPMKFQTKKFYSLLFVLVIFLQLYLPSFKGNLFIQIGLLGFYFLMERLTISVSYAKTVSLVFLVFFIGFIGTIVHGHPFFEVSKDVFHFLKPITGLLIGYFFYKRIDDFRLFVKTIVWAGLLSAMAHFATVLLFSGLDTVSDLREYARDNYLELFALFFILFYKKFQGRRLFDSKRNNQLITVILLLSCILYFSRTMIVAAVILLLSIYGFTIITKNTLKIVGLLVLLVGCMYLYLFSVKIDRNGNSFESFFYKVKNAPAEIFETRIDRTNHFDLWDHWRGYEAKRAFALMNDNPSSYVFGNGYGSLVNLKFFAPLNDSKKGLKYISELHNGYIYMLYKVGILGLLVYLSFLGKLYRRIYSIRTMPTVLLSAIGLVFFFTTLTITGIYNAKDIIVFIAGALLYFETKRPQESA